MAQNYLQRNLLIFIAGAILVIVLDQVTKAAITARFSLHESYPVISGFFNLVYVKNPGAAFSLLADAPAPFRHVFFIGVTLVAAGLILYYLIRSKTESILMIVCLTLIFAGAVGNLVDRIRFGAVVDFLDFYIGTAHWPAFNVADSAITVGAALMIWEMLISGKKKTVRNNS